MPMELGKAGRRRLSDPRDDAGAPSTSDAEHAIAVWREHDAAHALHGHDRDVVRASDAPRALVLEHLARPGPVRDLYNACAWLGRLLADAGASPSLAVGTIDGAASALSELGIAYDPARLPPARASIAEGYFAAVLESERKAARRAWEYPACAVKVAKDVVAIVAGYPADDGEALADWAARVALAVSREGYRSAVLAGEPAAKAELGNALSLLGVALASSADSPGWFTALLKRS
jgi:hypothetical protein